MIENEFSGSLFPRKMKGKIRVKFSKSVLPRSRSYYSTIIIQKQLRHTNLRLTHEICNKFIERQRVFYHINQFQICHMLYSG